MSLCSVSPLHYGHPVFLTETFFFQWIPLLTAELQSTYPNIAKKSSVAVRHNTRYKWEAIRTKWGPQCTKLIVGNLFPRCSSKLPFPIHSPPVTAALSIGSQQYRISEHAWNLTAFKDLISNTFFKFLPFDVDISALSTVTYRIHQQWRAESQLNRCCKCHHSHWAHLRDQGMCIWLWWNALRLEALQKEIMLHSRISIARHSVHSSFLQAVMNIQRQNPL